MTSIRIDGTRLIARNGRRTRIVRMADKLKLSPGKTDSTNLKNKNKNFVNYNLILTSGLLDTCFRMTIRGCQAREYLIK